MSLARAVAYPFHLPDRCKTLYLEPNTGKANLQESTKGDRMIRYERMLEVLSSFTISQLMFAGGNGRSIKTAAIHAAKEAVARSKTRFKSDLSFWTNWRKKIQTQRFGAIVAL